MYRLTYKLLFSIILFYSAGIYPQKSNVNMKLNYISAASQDSSCVVYIEYPQLEGMDDPLVEDKLNELLHYEFTADEDWYTEVESCGDYIILNYEVRADIVFRSEKVISILRNTFYYGGGAHPLTTTDGYNIQLSDGKLLVLSDIINQNFLPEFYNLVEEKLRNKFGMKSLVEAGLFEEKILPGRDQDFNLSENTLILHFDPYEIAPYAMGPIEISFSFDEIQNFISPNSVVKHK